MDNVLKSIQKLNKINNQNYEFAIYEQVNNEEDYIKYVKYISGKTEKNGAIFSNTQPYTWQQVLEQFPQVELDMALDNLRAKRNKLLVDSDYIVLADSPVNDKANWLTYRQALRDLTNGLTTIEQVNNVTWPIKP